VVVTGFKEGAEGACLVNGMASGEGALESYLPDGGFFCRCKAAGGRHGAKSCTHTLVAKGEKAELGALDGADVGLL
jgi:hypothetical protein